MGPFPWNTTACINIQLQQSAPVVIVYYVNTPSRPNASVVIVYYMNIESQLNASAVIVVECLQPPLDLI